MPSTTLKKQYFLITSLSDPYCVPITCPVDCTKADNPECWGGKVSGAFNPSFLAVISLAFFTLLIAMALVVHSEIAISRRKGTGAYARLL